MEASCTICGNKSVELKDQRLNMYKCDKCDHAFSLIPVSMKVEYDEDYYAEKHENWFNNPNIWLFSLISRKIREVVGSRGITLLDVGCGKGDFLKFMRAADHSIDLYGIDLSDNEYPGITFIKDDFMKSEPDKKFDVVTSMAAIEHVSDVNVFINKMKSVIKAGGLVVVTTDNTGGLFYGIARAMKKFGIKTPFYSLYEPAHLQHFTNKSLRVLFERNGLNVVYQRNHNYPIKAIDLPAAGFLARSIYLAGAWIIFTISFNFGILQTIFCIVEDSHDKTSSKGLRHGA